MSMAEAPLEVGVLGGGNVVCREQSVVLDGAGGGRGAGAGWLVDSGGATLADR